MDREALGRVLDGHPGRSFEKHRLEHLAIARHVSRYLIDRAAKRQDEGNHLVTTDKVPVERGTRELARIAQSQDAIDTTAHADSAIAGLGRYDPSDNPGGGLRGGMNGRPHTPEIGVSLNFENLLDPGWKPARTINADSRGS